MSQGPPDHGYSWAVLTAAVFLHFMAAGNFGTFGLLFVEFVDYFGASKAAVSWIGGIQIATYGISGNPTATAKHPQYTGYDRNTKFTFTALTILYINLRPMYN